MENAADALKIAFAVLVFIIAITIIFIMISKVKSTADVALYYSDKTNFYDHYETEESKKDEKGNRIVTASDIIATLYRYYKESVAITIIMDGETYYFDLGNEYLSDGETKQSIATVEGKERNLGKFINEKLKNCDYKFIEEFSETPIGGKYLTGNDGSEITLTKDGKKVYVTYTKKT